MPGILGVVPLDDQIVLSTGNRRQCRSAIMFEKFSTRIGQARIRIREEVV